MPGRMAARGYTASSGVPHSQAGCLEQAALPAPARPRQHYLTVGAWPARGLPACWRDRNWLRSPFSIYSVIMHSGSSAMHTASSRMMLGSFSRDMILISFRKSFLSGTETTRIG